MLKQTTIGREVTIPGVNPFDGRKISATMAPGKEDEGLVLIVGRTKIPYKLENADYLSHWWKTRGGNTVVLRKDGAEAAIPEHGISAFKGHNISNARIYLPQSIFPTTEHCGREYSQAIKDAGIVEQSKERVLFQYFGDHEDEFRWKKRKPDMITIGPASGLFLGSVIEYDHYPCIGRQTFSSTLTPQTYTADIMDARPPIKSPFSFEFPDWFIAFTKLIGAQGTDKTNYGYIHVGGKTYDNPPEFNVLEKEFARHKILDIIGEIPLLEGQLGGQITDTALISYCTGHESELSIFKQFVKGKYFTQVPFEVKAREKAYKG